MSKAIVCDSFSGLDALTYQGVETPTITHDEVLIKTRYAGVNYPDTLIVQGKYQFTPELPFSPGQEVSGEVLAIGENVDHVSVGDIVIASMTWGGFGQEVKAHKDNVYLLPPNISLNKGAAILETYGTVMHALKDRGTLKVGETLAVLGASGGTGTAALQLGQLFGAKTIAVCSTEEKRSAALANGAAVAIGYDNLKNDLKTYGVDVLFDPVGGTAAEQAFRSLKPGGRHLVVGFASGDIPAIPFNLPLLKSASIVGVFWGGFWRAHPQQNRRNILQVLHWMNEGKLDVKISKEYPLAEAKTALDDLMQRRAVGKIILKTT